MVNTQDLEPNPNKVVSRNNFLPSSVSGGLSVPNPSDNHHHHHDSSLDFPDEKTSKQTKGTRSPPPMNHLGFPSHWGWGEGGALLSRYSLSNISVPSISHHVTNYCHNFTRIEFSMLTKIHNSSMGAKSSL